MTHHHDPRHKDGDAAKTAAEEVFEEAEDAATRRPGDERDPGKDGEAADALTPDAGAQEDARRDDGARRGDSGDGGDSGEGA
ncbi:hypothetical protein [Streptomyces spectabilis]|uniref:Uncharacterized protein n=1 Tax=Streptomyces spectabilis TaxID=68270 RepID=A0A5P2X5D1_STRST|nr:hypothetical protein [Streptomyces spectabilis]MBB5101649.1 hypothetical protein [Streptomyces spectabilis]MCI3900831.1 hypothetical protein [Streptomyces spectabilis]QEV58355.1 hypothetical protein CP982_06235 [Streptomyces spectabilis]GGV12717.1 hypothetical protein GCM10010245_23340 [Streptomyces spectabilis]